ncbi:DMT family transporter [Plastoroseomonas hellenica]|uniref:DMT family transporter n=1 Tax=Plastoroseomonas hellenica TaxID=2687306 RepID=UPI001BA73833|nr:DMT family transporter [Plastoroseomonas hellenica]MBR0647875.1 DMT family transporter [Plastoroseomonas hellenica]
MDQSLSARAWALLLLLALLWGGSFFFIGVAVREAPPLLVAWSRVAMAAIALWLAVVALRVPVPRSGAAVVTLAGMGLLNNVIPFSLIAYGQAHLPSGFASILNATTPVWGVVLGVAAFRQPATWPRALGVALGFAGVLVLMGPEKLVAPGADLLPILALLAASISYALTGFWARRIARDGIAPLAAAAGQVTASALILAPALLLAHPPGSLAMPSMAGIAALLGLGLVSTALAYAVFFRIIAIAGGGNAMLVTFLIPPVAILLGVAFLGEALLPRHLGGLALILAGLALIDGRVLRR